ncbi:MAG TPA: hypothetical protein VE860_07855 [Chthoniobacterales bacterium]|nr:hypothetical protein [Chthoniobacterales bacterium]
MEISGKVSSILADQDSITVWSNGPNATVFDAIQLMDEKNVEALPVLQHGIELPAPARKTIDLEGRIEISVVSEWNCGPWRGYNTRIYRRDADPGRSRGICCYGDGTSIGSLRGSFRCEWRCGRFQREL